MLFNGVQTLVADYNTMTFFLTVPCDAKMAALRDSLIKIVIYVFINYVEETFPNALIFIGR